MAALIRRAAVAGRREVLIVRQCHSNRQERNALSSYMQKVLDNPLPLGAGALVVGILQWKRIKSRNEAQQEKLESEVKVLSESDWQVTCYKSLPLRHFSRLWGFINDIYLPVWLRTRLLGYYARTFGCDVTEAEVEDLAQYNNLGEFFRRRLKLSARPLSEEPLVAPCDGKVLHFGPVDVHRGLVEQVKGVTYSLTAFLGSYFNTTPHTVPFGQPINEVCSKRLYQCVMYLAPGDYHGFHSPVHWTVNRRRHFPGELLSVHPRVVGLVGKLFELNERVVYLGEWEHGFFSMTAVGATNVGSVKVAIDEDLATNCRKWEAKTFHQKIFKDDKGEGVEVKKGDYFGEFNLGSTIVLIFEAPENFQFSLQPDQTIRVGQSILEPKTLEAVSAPSPAAAS